MASRSLAADQSPENVAAWSARAVDRYDLELVNHFELEEELLFPVCAGALADRLINEHRTLEAFVSEMREAPSREVLEKFLELLRNHIRLEENEFFEAAQRTLPAEQLQAIGEEIDRRAVRICL